MMADTQQEVKPTSFYGASKRKNLNKSYLTPLQRKTIRERMEMMNIKNGESSIFLSYTKENLFPQKNSQIQLNNSGELVLKNKNSSLFSARHGKRSKSTGNSVKKRMKCSVSGGFLPPVLMKSSKKRSGFACKSSNKMSKLHSPTINWAPLSLGKRYLQTSMLKYSPSSAKQVKTVCNEGNSCSGSIQIDIKVATGKVSEEALVKLSQPDSNEARKTNKISLKVVENCDEELGSTADVGLEPVSTETLLSTAAAPVFNKKNVPHCAKELFHNNVDSIVGESIVQQVPVSVPVAYEGMEGESSQMNNNNNNTELAKTKYFPIFTPEHAPKQSQILTTKGSSPCHSADNHSTISPKTLRSSLRISSKTSSESPKPKQMIIDAGQKKFGAVQCDACNMVYTVSDPCDQQQHSLHHKRFLSIIKFTGWKRERVVASYMDGRILKVLPNDPKYAINKVDEIQSLVDVDLGFSFQRDAANISTVTYLYISESDKIVGCLIANQITRAHRLLPSSDNCSSAMICSPEVESAACGISKLWTYSPYRRRGIASRLIDTLRSTFLLGLLLDKDQIAFSDPTLDGKKFATSYFKTNQFLTYNFQ